MPEHELCQMKIENMKEDISEFKKDVREHLKEVRETHKLYAETLTAMRENIVRLASLAERQDEKLDVINRDIAELKRIKNDKQTDDMTPWFQKVFENKDKFIMYILLVLLAFALGLRVESLTGFLG